MHGGSKPEAKRNAERNLALTEAQQLVNKLGVPIEIDSADALEQLVWESAGNVAFYRAKVQALKDGELVHDSIVGKSPDVFIKLYDDERTRLAQYASLALKAGVDERRVQLAEISATRLFDALVDALAVAGLTPAQEEAIRGAIANNLRSISAT
jgi:hypothetical protein